MSKIWGFIKTHFITKKFLTFGIIGVLNTGIHLVVYKICYNYIQIPEEFFLSIAFVSNSIAFISASIFSYFANAIYTFKPKKKSTSQFSIVMLVYFTRLLISSLLTSWFDYIFINLLNFDYNTYNYLELLAPLLASALLIPIAYFALDWVFKKTDKQID